MNKDFDLSRFTNAKGGLDELGAFRGLANVGLNGHCIYAISLNSLDEIFGPLPAASCNVVYDDVGAPFT